MILLIIKRLSKRNHTHTHEYIMYDYIHVKFNNAE